MFYLWGNCPLRVPSHLDTFYNDFGIENDFTKYLKERFACKIPSKLSGAFGCCDH